MNDIKKFIKESYHYHFLSEEKEKEINERLLKKDKKAREELINSHIRMVYPIARKFCRGNITPLEDLVQEGLLGLVTAADKFDPNKNIRFCAYAKWWITEFIKRKFYKEFYLVKTPLRVIRKSFRIKNEEENLEKEKKKGENKAILNILKKPIYLDDHFNSSSDSTQGLNLIDSLYDKRENAEERNEKYDLRKFLFQKIESFLNPQEIAVLVHRYLEPDEKMTYKTLGDKLKLSSETIRNIEKRSISKLKRRLEKDSCLSYL